jgi:hypothetical protein
MSSFLSLVACATNYYFSNAGSDQNSGTSKNSPYKTITKLNSLYLLPGDSVFFREGDTFLGTIKLSSSGGSRKSIYFGSYDNGGHKPIISGFTTVSSWKSIGNGLFSAQIGSLSSCNMVTLDNSFQPMGKFPRGNKGYFNISKVNTGTNTITSNTTTKNNPAKFASAPNAVGGEICWRPFHWVLWRGTITAQTGSTITYKPFASTSGGGTENPQAGYGFFIQNSPSVCTQLGDWAYDGSTNTLTMFFGSSVDSHSVEVATSDIVIDLQGRSNITFENLSLEGANSYLISGNGSANIAINNCDIKFAGLFGIFANGDAPNWRITNNNISWCNSIGVRVRNGATSAVFTGNTVTYCGAIAGMGGTGEGQYFGALGFVDGTIEYNTFKHIGYIALSYTLAGAGSTVAKSICRFNTIDSFGDVKDDAGGIYCNGSDMSGTVIANNFVFHGLGCPEGTPDADLRAQGIYVDDAAHNLEIGGNTIAFMGRSGIYLHDAHEINMHHNTLWDNKSSIGYYNEHSAITNIVSKHNINFAKASDGLVSSAGAGSSAAGYFAANGLDSNYYASPGGDAKIFRSDETFHNLSAWKKFVGQDAHSAGAPKTISSADNLKFVYNNTTSNRKISLGGKYIDVRNTLYDGSITLAPFTSAVLIYQGK